MDIVGIGNALLDVIAFVDDDFAPSLGFHNGATVHLSRERLSAVLGELPDPVRVAGGGSANTLRIASLLGAKTRFVGSVGEDADGAEYRRDLSSAGVGLELLPSPSATGLFVNLLRADGLRTVLVAPGAALDLCRSEPDPGLFRPGSLLYLEGFILRDKAWFVSCLEAARKAGMAIALDLASCSLVEAERGFFLEILGDYCDYLFANADEFVALADLPLAEGVDLLADSGPALVVKLGDRGALYAKGEERLESPVRALVPVDETGAGDAFAAGFLVAASRGLSPERCLRLGNRVAEEVLLAPGLAVDPERLLKAVSSVLD
jgi:sugar/nucleoside kinase (ribokinase family)